MKDSKVASLIGAKPGDLVAHGYTFARTTVDIYWDNNRFERWEMVYTEESRLTQVTHSGVFTSDMFFDNIKRFYRDQTNGKLIDIFRAFGRPLLITG